MGKKKGKGQQDGGGDDKKPVTDARAGGDAQPRTSGQQPSSGQQKPPKDKQPKVGPGGDQREEAAQQQQRGSQQRQAQQPQAKPSQQQQGQQPQQQHQQQGARPKKISQPQEQSETSQGQKDWKKQKQQGQPQHEEARQQQHRGPQQGPQQGQPQLEGQGKKEWKKHKQQGQPQQQQHGQAQPQGAWQQQRGPQQSQAQPPQPQGARQQQRGSQQSQTQPSQPQGAWQQQRGSQQSQAQPPQPDTTWSQKAPQSQQAQSAGRQQQQQRAPHADKSQKGGFQSQPDSSKKSSAETSPSVSHSPSLQSITSEVSKMSVAPSHVSLARGTKGRKIVVETNYLQLIIDKIIDNAYQYDIKFDPDKPKRFLRAAFDEYRIQNCPKIFLAFDGKSIVYSPCKLPDKILSKAFEVKVLEAESGQEKMFKVTLKETNDPVVELKSLKNYQTARIFDKPMRAIQCIDVVLRSPCYKRAVQAGRSFYTAPRETIDLQDGYELWYGLFQAAVLGETPLLNIDICHKSFPSDKNVIDLIRMMRYANVEQELDRRNYEELKAFLRGLIIVYKPPDGTRDKRYKFNDLMDSAERQQFVLENGQRMSISNYFSQMKRYNLRYPKMPCLHVGNPARNIYLPAEFCIVARGQATMKKAGTNQVRALIKYAAVDTLTRKSKIMTAYNNFNHDRDPTIQNFGLGIGKNFLDVNARIINAPRLQYGSALIEPSKGSWRAENVPYIQPSNLDKWAILITDKYCKDFDARKLGDMVCKSGRSLNMQINPNYAIFKEENNRRFDDQFKKFRSEKYQLVFVIISSFGGDSYAAIKQCAEIRHGVLTQCIKKDTVEKRLNLSTVNNILLKVNAKLNGENHRIGDNDKTPIMDDNVMFLGADVTHPSPDQRSIPSVVGVAASHDQHGFQYNMRWRLQDPKKEIIQDMQAILKEQLEFYKRQRGCYPKKIMYYRDGVSEGQFEQVRATELTAMNRACANIKPQPLITCIVVQKRHHTRFFPKPGTGVGDRDRFKNVPPGTIVDTKITHPNESQFFLVSHESIQGTAKPTKYCVIRDDAKLNIDDLQAITFNLCHMFSRCNRSVSYPAPAYNAHLAASRGKVYIELMDRRQTLNLNNLNREYTSRQVQESIYIGQPMYFV